MISTSARVAKLGPSIADLRPYQVERPLNALDRDETLLAYDT